MTGRTGTGFGRLFLLGLALAYAATGFVDKPAPIHFRTDTSAPSQSIARESDAQAVLRMNVFKLGDPLSMQLLSPDAAPELADDNWNFKGEVQPFTEQEK
ncbi:hypothetical protein [Pseudodesulfovibrio senegalensis]|jgi:hypothetical protein|uniref:Uncharacterized protein n=1 Tax=Pseudodesulfovibrio senegalensis TaxID=1721087 RepID=A0A6N6MZS2_9BACT|nr:hypothetical protein [Pseudodesulfovibrio senegalensis]KAB1440779.1 hypothetical protein F8A88_12570 [Pseudodesulfovibrio senegalensis]